MAFEAKLMIVFNERNMPKLDVDDHAFWKRLLLIEHRSLFCCTAASYAEHAAEPHTFMGEPDMKDRVNPNATMAWMLAGLSRFNDDGRPTVRLSQTLLTPFTG